MKQIALQAVPNQSFSVLLDGAFYNFRFAATNGVMACDITRDNEILLTGQRCVSGYPLIPYQYLATGNFIILTQNEEYPYYTEFGNTQFLIYGSLEELEALNV